MSDILERARKVTAEVLKVDPAKISENTRFVEDLGAKSLQSIELIAAMEAEFEVEFDEDEAMAMKTVKDAIRLIERVMQ